MSSVLQGLHQPLDSLVLNMARRLSPGQIACTSHGIISSLARSPRTSAYPPCSKLEANSEHRNPQIDVSGPALKKRNKGFCPQGPSLHQRFLMSTKVCVRE